MIKLITLDLDNTLWDVTPVLIAAEKKLQEYVHTHIPEAKSHYQWDNLSQIRREILRQRPEVKNLPTTLRLNLLEDCFKQAGFSPSAAEQLAHEAFEIFLTYRNNIPLFPETLPLLTKLSQEFELIALSNGNADINRVGLGHFFKAHFSAESVGKPKPAPDMFESALAHAQVDASEAIHIGDHQEEDVEAARKLGFHTIWFNQHGKQTEQTCEPTTQVHTLGELENAIFALHEAKKNPAL